jgi:hypothetical protein
MPGFTPTSESIKCPYCPGWSKNEESFKGHKYRCPNWPIQEANEKDLLCSHCEKSCKNINSWRNHQRLCKKNPDRQLTSFERNPHLAQHVADIKKARGTTSNGALKAKQEGRKFEISEETREKLSTASKKQVWSEERKRQHSATMREVVINRPESYSSNNVCGRVKRHTYSGTTLLGSWELLVAECLDREEIKWTNEISPIQYTWEGTDRLYFPDFYLPELDLYIEVKGYKRDIDCAKWAAVPNLIILMKQEIDNLKKGECITNLLK